MNIVEKRGNDFYVLAKLSPDDGILASQEDWHVGVASVARDSMGQRCIDAQLDECGGDLLANLTRRNMNRTLCIFIDDEVPRLEPKPRYHGPLVSSPLARGRSVAGLLSRSLTWAWTEQF